MKVVKYVVTKDCKIPMPTGAKIIYVDSLICGNLQQPNILLWAEVHINNQLQNRHFTIIEDDDEINEQHGFNYIGTVNINNYHKHVYEIFKWI